MPLGLVLLMTHWPVFPGLELLPVLAHGDVPLERLPCVWRQSSDLRERFVFLPELITG